MTLQLQSELEAASSARDKLSADNAKCSLDMESSRQAAAAKGEELQEAKVCLLQLLPDVILDCLVWLHLVGASAYLVGDAHGHQCRHHQIDHV